MSLSRGFRLGHYEIVSTLGKGGMGEVYRARDTRLDRDVAIKILPDHLVEDPTSIKRLEREAKTLAALSHPNLITIHDVGTVEGISFVVMELLEGETLRHRIERDLSWEKALEIAVAVADGLSAAHSKGVIHRDLKPENIFLASDGRVKILDFGLARQKLPTTPELLTEAPTQWQMTQPGFVMGTVPYMSPEQIRGESADAQSDIFSYGCVLYEMLSGRRPFVGGSSSEITASILKEDPPRLTESARNIPPDLERIVRRCLEKNREARFHSAHDLAFDLKSILSSSGRSTSIEVARAGVSLLRRWVIAAAVLTALIALAIGWNWDRLRETRLGARGAPRISSLAVLPLKNLSGDPKQEYFADGMTEELIAKLARIEALHVISRTSVMEYKDARKPLPEIARELNVDAIVEGSVLQAGDRVRITAQLIHAPTDRHLWAESYERDSRDVLTLQNEVARAIAHEIQIKLTPEESSNLTASQQVNPEAYQAYLRGLTYTRSPDLVEGWRLATEMFERAVHLDPNFAQAYTELAQGHAAMYHFYQDHTPERLAKAKRAVDRAFQLHPGLAEAHLALGIYYYWGLKQPDQALSELSVAQKSLPNNLRVLEGFAAVYRYQGNLQAAIENFKRIEELNPRDAATPFNLGVTFTMMRLYPEADSYFDRSISLAPDQSYSYGSKAENYLLWKGDTHSARAILERVRKKDTPEIHWAFYWIDICERNYRAALDQLLSSNFEVLEGEAGLSGHKDMLIGWTYQLLNDPKSARIAFDSARRKLEKEIEAQPSYRFGHSQLGIVYAGLGRKQDAVREATVAVNLRPVSQNILVGRRLLLYLSHVNAMVGNYDAAIDQLESLLSSTSSLISIPLLRIDPRWDPLRRHPRFQKLLEQFTDSQPGAQKQ